MKTTPMVSRNQNLSLCSLVILPPIYQHFRQTFPKYYNTINLNREQKYVD